MEVGGCCMCNLVQFVRFNPALWTGVGVRNVGCCPVRDRNCIQYPRDCGIGATHRLQSGRRAVAAVLVRSAMLGEWNCMLVPR